MSNKYLIVIVEDEYNISSFVSAVLQANSRLAVIIMV